MSIKNYLFVSLFFITSLFPLAVFSGENSTYDFTWLDPDKEVYVLQNRKYRKVNKIHINLGAGTTTSGPFVDAYSYQGRVGYFFHEEWGFEALYAMNQGKENDTFATVVNNGQGSAGSTPFRRVIDNYMGAMILWSPFYAKINTFNKILYLDWILGLGYAKMEETNNRQFIQSPALANPKYTTESHDCLIWGTALKFHISEYFNLRVDFTGLHYEAQKGLTIAGSEDKDYYYNYDLTLSLGVNF